MSAPLSPFGDAAIRPARPWGLIGLVLALLVVRLVLLPVLPLTEDEAYYRLWARTPALGYFDHPPMIAWWTWAGMRLAGDSGLGVRLLPVLASAATSVFVFDCARRLGADRIAAERAGVWSNATILAAAGGLLATPDAPAAFFWTLTVWAVVRAGRNDGLGWWIACGMFAGLACLSKYSALFLGPGVLLWLSSTPSGRKTLATPGPWLALLIAMGLFSLNVSWNAAHGWPTFQRQFGRVAPHAFAPRHLAEFLAAEVLLLNPILCIFLFRVGPRDEHRVRPGTAVLWLTSAPLLAYLALHSLHDQVEAHWPAPVFPLLATAAALQAEEARGWRRALRRATPWVGLGGCAIAGAWLCLPLVGVPILFDPAAPLRGWPEFTARLESLRAGAGARWIGVSSYGLAAQLMDQKGLDAPIIQISERRRWTDLKDGSRADTSRPGLIIDLQRRLTIQRLEACFSSVTPLGRIERGGLGEPGTRYAAYLVRTPLTDIVTRGCGPG